MEQSIRPDEKDYKMLAALLVVNISLVIPLMFLVNQEVYTNTALFLDVIYFSSVLLVVEFPLLLFCLYLWKTYKNGK